MSVDERPPSAASGRDDSALVSAIGRGEESALAELVERYQARLFNIAYRYLGSRDDAELATQDIFIRIWHNAKAFRGSSQVWTWIFRIAVNICCDSRPRNQLNVCELDDSQPVEARHEPSEAHERGEQDVIVRQALDSLPDDQRMVVVLTRFEGLSYVEAAQVMNRSVSAVATLLFRAKENLRTRLRPFVLRGKLLP